MFDLSDHIEVKNPIEITSELKQLFNQVKMTLKGSDCRKFMAQIVLLLGKGGQSRAEHELGWDRKTIRIGLHELKSGIT